jgi:L-ascorbate metabolism protein UlaG (beta-lactamase superfamily)
MFLRRLDDYQSWQVIHRGTSILIDPWLTSDAIEGVFNRVHGDGFVSWDDLQREAGTVSAVILCTSVDDHTRPDSLSRLVDVPVWGPVKAAKAARSAGCRSTHVAKIGEAFELPAPEGGCLRIVPTKCGLPLGLIAQGYVIEGIDDTGTVVGRIWIEPHQPTVRVARAIAPIDVAILPSTSVTAIVLPVTSGLARSARAAAACSARAIVPTATEPARDMARWQRAVYFTSRGSRRLRRRLVGTRRLVELRPRDWLDVTSGR